MTSTTILMRKIVDKFYKVALEFNDWLVLQGITEEGVIGFSYVKHAIQRNQRLADLIKLKFKSSNNCDVERITITWKEWEDLHSR